VTEVIDPRYVSEHNPEGIPRSCGVSCAWISTLYQPGGGTFASVLKDDGSIQVAADPEDEAPAQDPSWRASRDIWDHPAWRAWLKEHFRPRGHLPVHTRRRRREEEVQHDVLPQVQGTQLLPQAPGTGVPHPR
jgi:hypothetical protein